MVARLHLTSPYCLVWMTCCAWRIGLQTREGLARLGEMCVVVVRIAFTTHERWHINSVRLNMGRRDTSLDTMVRKSFFKQGVQMRRLCKDSSEWSLGPWIISLGVAYWPADTYPCARGHRYIIAQHSNENGAGAVCTEAVTHR